MMKSKVIDITNLSTEAALLVLCREINSLRKELVETLNEFDGEAVVMADGITLEERLRKLEGK